MAGQASGDGRRPSPAPLRRLVPYIGKYRGLVLGAVISLVAAALTTLALPVAVRRMIDHGFSSSDSTFIAKYFAMLVVMAAVLAWLLQGAIISSSPLVSASSPISVAMSSRTSQRCRRPFSTPRTPARSSRGWRPIRRR